MQLTFKKVRWKNFINTGNSWVEIDFLAAKSTLIVGKNGAGKSTLLDAICFGLFNKPFRDCTKPELVNNMNRKDCVVEIEFSANGKPYKIVRGIKPAIFEIYAGNDLVNQEAASKDYQEYLESFILKMNYKTFTQIEILGSAAFIPFMRLPAAQRREVIESILDIEVFSVMNTIVKARAKETDQLLRQITSEINTLDSTFGVLTKTKFDLERDNQSFIDDRKKDIDALSAEMPAIKSRIVSLNEMIAEWNRETAGANALLKELNELHLTRAKMETKKQRYNSDIIFFNQNSICSTCRQPITETHKKEIVGTANAKIADFDKAIRGLQRVISKKQVEVGALQEIMQKAETANREVRDLASQLGHVKHQIGSLQKDIDNALTKKTSVGDIIQQLEEISQNMIQKRQIEISTEDDKRYLDLANKLLKDGGIKAMIVKRYLPLINKTVNKYLAALDFYIGFEIDENFNAKIKRRFREDSSYGSMSQGEKMRIDLALLLTWREVAKQKNSVNTNLLIMDEIFDGPLDNGGIEEFMKLMNAFEDKMNFVVISHKDLLQDKFDRVIRFSEQRNFSHMEMLDG